MIAALILAAIAPAAAATHVGDVEELSLITDRAGEHDGGSSSSHDSDTIVARVLAVRPEGVELEYDLPPQASPDERASTWQFPLRVFRPASGPARLSDRPALEARIDAWLKTVKLPRSACGHLVFTWNAFRIECDPSTALATVAAFELSGPEPREGATYREAGTQAQAILVRRPGTPVLVAELAVDPEAVRRAEAERDVGVGEILQKPVTLEAALAKHAGETVTGTITVSFDLGDDGLPWRRTRLTRTRIVAADGKVETETVKQVLTRRLRPADQAIPQPHKLDLGSRPG